MRLFEKHRPTTLAEVVGQPKAVAQVSRLIERGAGGKSFWFSGPSGSGKTTLARIIAGTVADDWATTTVVGRSLSPSKVLELFDDLRTYSLGKGGRALVIDEAHGLSGPTIEVLLDCLERIPSHAVVCFTTTKLGEEKLFADHDDASPLLSRCAVVTLTNQGLARAFAERALTIARAEGLDGQPVEAYVKLANKHKSNMRAMLQDIESGCMVEGGGK